MLKTIVATGVIAALALVAQAAGVPDDDHREASASSSQAATVLRADFPPLFSQQ